MGEVVGGPPVSDAAFGIEGGALGVEGVGDLVADDGADSAVVRGGRRPGVEEGRLEDGGGEVEPVVERQVDGIDGLGRHTPLLAIDELADATDVVLTVEEAGAEEVAEEVVGFDFKGGIGAPVSGVADRDLEGAEFRESFFFGGRSHPGDGLEALAEGDEEVGDEGFGLSFGFRGEVAPGVDLADGIAENGGDEDVSTESPGGVARVCLRGCGRRS